MSSTSVYGDHDGAWVTEETVPNNVGERGAARLIAEDQWIQVARESRKQLAVMRLSAIYGPNRSSIRSLRRYPNVVHDYGVYADKYVSRIHRDDLVAAIVKAIMLTDEKDSSIADISVPTFYNLADDMPASAAQVYEFAEQLLRAAQDKIFLEKEAEIKKAPGPNRKVSRRGTDGGNKKVSNAKMKQILLPTLSYPTYKHGLSALAEDMFK